MNAIHLSEINLYAVFVAWIIHTVSGLLWFQPKLFGNDWSKLTGKELKPAKNWIIAGLAGHLIMIFVLVIIIKMANIDNGIGGLFAGLLCWIGFVYTNGNRRINLGEDTFQTIPYPNRESIHRNGYFRFHPWDLAMNI